MVLKNLKNKIKDINLYNKVYIMTTIYLIHENGGRPYKVEINNETNIVNIYKYEKQQELENQNFKESTVLPQILNDLKTLKYEDSPVVTVTAKKIFIGKSPYNEQTAYSGGHDEYFDGNTILLKLEKNKYMFICYEIFTFDSFYGIKEFVSPVGNNDVPYPYAIDKQNNYYLLINDVVFNLTDKVEDPYRYYYDNSLITKDDGIIPPVLPTTIFKDIKEFYINGEKYTMTFRTNKEKCLENYYPNDIMIKKYDNKKYKISYHELQNLYKEFGELKGFKLLKNKHIIQYSL